MRWSLLAWIIWFVLVGVVAGFLIIQHNETSKAAKAAHRPEKTLTDYRYAD